MTSSTASIFQECCL